MVKKILEIIIAESIDTCSSHTVGKYGVVAIEEIEDYLPKPCFRILFDDGRMIKSFNACTIFYAKG